MRVSVDLKGEGVHEVDLAALEVDEPTYADVLGEFDVSPHEVSVLVDGRPVPEDRQVDATEITVLKLITGGGQW